MLALNRNPQQKYYSENDENKTQSNSISTPIFRLNGKQCGIEESNSSCL